jgi:hypothetical protein
MTEINGKIYPLWSQFVSRKSEWIDGKLQDFGDPIDAALMNQHGKGLYPLETTITDIRLEPNGDDSAFFYVVGKDFTCGFDVRCGGIAPESNEDWLAFRGYGGHKWRISKRGVPLPKDQ